MSQLKAYPDGSWPCSCCGTPIGFSSHALRYNKTCYGCRGLHDKAACARGRAARIADNRKVMVGQA